MLSLLFIFACGSSAEPESAAQQDSQTPSDSAAWAPTQDSDAGSLEPADSGPGWSPAEDAEGPSYGACVSDAECAPGEACTTVDGFAGLYCAPPCEPEGDGEECDLDGSLSFETTCTETARCARVCPEEEDSSCPPGLECQDSGDQRVCAGPPAGSSGYYGVCSHPNVEGSDCPDDSTCFGGDYLGIDAGVCLPWCPDYSCPEVEEGDASPYCYDVGLEMPICALICVPDQTQCPSDQYCYDLGFIGLCAPEGALNPYE